MNADDFRYVHGVYETARDIGFTIEPIGSSLSLLNENGEVISKFADSLGFLYYIHGYKDCLNKEKNNETS